MSSPPFPDPVREMERRCTAHGLPVTAQRRLVMEVVAPRMDHPTVEQIHGWVEDRLEGVSKATVYRTLELFVRLGLVRAVIQPGAVARYDANLAPHHHFVCDQCGAVRDLPIERVRGSEGLAFVVGPERLEVHSVDVTVRGLCPGCRA